MKVLVTGGAGFIGSHVADALLSDGHAVHVLDNLYSGRVENIAPGVTFHELDLRDPGVTSLFEQERFEVVVHHAAQMDVRKSVSDPGFDADVNVIGFLNLMEAGRKNGLRKVIFASTGGAIYGEPDYVPQDEAHVLQPLSPYGITKLVTEKYLFFYNAAYGIDYVALRYANVYGPRQNPHGEAGVVAIFAERMLQGRQPIIYGDGRQTRDYVYVSDVVKANLAALRYDRSDIFNVGTGKETDVNELFHLIREITGATAEEQHAEGKPGEQRRSVLRFNKAESALGWFPRRTLEDGLRETIAWFAEQTAKV